VTYHVFGLFGDEGDAAGAAIFNFVFDEAHSGYFGYMVRVRYMSN
jgi:hypothetical protein